MKKLILFLILSAVPANSITLSTIRTDCRVMVKDTGSSRRRFSDAQLLRWINEGQKDVVQQTFVLRDSHEFDLVAGTTYYNMRSNYLKPVRVTRDYQKLDERSIANLDKNSKWEEVAGLPTDYFIHFASRTKMGFYPFPDDSSSTGTIRVDYIATATDLASDSDQPFDGIQELQPYGFSLSLYCGYRASLIDGMFNMATGYSQEYERALSRIAEESLSRPAYKPGAIGRGNLGSE